MRAPPESFSPMTGAPTRMAVSMILTILAAFASDSEPPKTVKSCAKTKTTRPCMRPWPVMNPSPGTRCSAMPKSVARWVTNLSVSSNVPSSSRQIDALASGELARFPLALAAVGASAFFGYGVTGGEFGQAKLVDRGCSIFFRGWRHGSAILAVERDRPSPTGAQQI